MASALDLIKAAITALTTAPFFYRKAGARNSLRRELVVSFGESGL